MSTTFTNPLLPEGHADPWVIYHDGYYYYCGSGENHTIFIIKSKTLSDIGQKEKVIVWKAPEFGDHSQEIWAPELHWINDRWYIFYAADDGNNDNHRMFVLESASQDAQGTYIDKGKITDPSDKWAIDGTVLRKNDGSLYFIWSGWEGDVNEAQNLYIAPLSKEEPWKITGERVMISSPVYEWERKGFPYVNEGPQVLKKNGKIFVVYSASGSWTPDYCLGMLTTDEDSDVLHPDSWRKSPVPVFTRNDSEGVYGVGHASFTHSPDFSEDWIVYHGMSNPNAGWLGRSPRIQKFTWNSDGTPNFGAPVSIHTVLRKPSGE
jgi:GH43 family beta-xylosidase